jgi:hypothetical protein
MGLVTSVLATLLFQVQVLLVLSLPLFLLLHLLLLSTQLLAQPRAPLQTLHLLHLFQLQVAAPVSVTTPILLLPTVGSVELIFTIVPAKFPLFAVTPWRPTLNWYP